MVLIYFLLRRRWASQGYDALLQQTVHIVVMVFLHAACRKWRSDGDRDALALGFCVSGDVNGP